MQLNRIAKSMKERLMLHPYLFALWPTLFLFSHNIGELSIWENSIFIRLVCPIGGLLCLTLFLQIILGFIFQNRYAAGLMSSLCILSFFSYGFFSAVYAYIADHVIQRDALIELNSSFVVGPNKLYLFTCLFVISIGGYLLRRYRRSLNVITDFANVVASVLVLISLGNIVIHEVKRATLFTVPENASSAFVSSLAAENTPDIYYIILDAYASQSTLQEFYGYDNQPFLDALRERGFWVASESLSNYAFTTLSLPSSLEMNYLNYWTERLGQYSQDVTPQIELMSNNLVMRSLKKKGYEVIHFTSPSMMTEQNSFADRVIDCNQGGMEDRFLRMLIQSTSLASIGKYFPYQKEFEYIAKRERIQCKFSRLSRLTQYDKPMFVFAHILAPHFPYVFNVNGEPVSERERKELNAKVLYVNQLQYINTQVIRLLDRLFVRPERERPIIILQADHGPWNTDNWQDPDFYKIRMRILNAYYFPEGRGSHFYESISPVNTFRLLFNTYFNESYMLLEDKSYYSWYDAPYNFVEVSDAIRNAD